MNQPLSTCGCSKSPCACASPTPGGVCLTDACPPRPCFFNGQLITADDLNAVMTYFNTRLALLQRLSAGWGVYGGLRVDGAPGVPSRQLIEEIGPNPQVLAGTSLQVGAGTAIDALGRTLTLCSPVILDAAGQGVPAPQTKACAEWLGPFCPDPGADLTASELWVVAEYAERPFRPVPRYSGGEPCDPAPTCDFSRKQESLKVRLTSEAPPQPYAFTGCFDALALPELDPDTEGEDCTLAQGTFFDQVNALLAATCCSKPWVILGRVLLTANPGPLAGDLPSAPLYTIVTDAIPAELGAPGRRPVVSGGLLSVAMVQALCGESGGAEEQECFEQSPAETSFTADATYQTIPGATCELGGAGTYDIYVSAEGTVQNTDGGGTSGADATVDFQVRFLDNEGEVATSLDRRITVPALSWAPFQLQWQAELSAAEGPAAVELRWAATGNTVVIDTANGGSWTLRTTYTQQSDDGEG